MCTCVTGVVMCYFLFFFKQKTAFWMRISDWSSDVCSSDLIAGVPQDDGGDEQVEAGGAIGLVLEPPITQFAELVEEERACERVAGLALVEARLGTPAQINVAQPVEHEDRAFEAAQLAHRE